MANYGRFSRYTILDVLFDKNCKEVLLSDRVLDPSDASALLPPDATISNSDISLYEHFLTKYGLKVKFDKQPLLVVYEKTLKRHLYFLPEFSSFIGAPKNLDELASKDLNDTLRINPR